MVIFLCIFSSVLLFKGFIGIIHFYVLLVLLFKVLLVIFICIFSLVLLFKGFIGIIHFYFLLVLLFKCIVGNIRYCYIINALIERKDNKSIIVCFFQDHTTLSLIWEMIELDSLRPLFTINKITMSIISLRVSNLKLLIEIQSRICCRLSK